MIDPTSMTCVTLGDGSKLGLPEAVAVIVHVPAVNVTTLPDNVHAPEAANVGTSPDGKPVTSEIAVAVGVYVSNAWGAVGTVDVKATV